MEPRLIKLRYPANCRCCGRAIARGDAAWWTSDVKVVRCAICGPVDGAEPRDLNTARRSVAGASARAEHDRRRRNDEQKELARHPRTGRLRLALGNERQSTKAWEQGAIGEERVGARLDKLESDGAVVVHDRRIPGSRSNIDHIVIARSAIWVVDTKHYSGQIRRRDVGGWFRYDERLFVGRRDRTRLVEAMAGQVTAVRNALTPTVPPIRPVLCFTGAEWSFMADPFELYGVLITWPRALVKQIRTRPSTGIDVEAIAAQLVNLLPTAR